MTRIYRRFLYRLPWIQEEWTATGYRLMGIHLANLNCGPKIEPMEKV